MPTGTTGGSDTHDGWIVVETLAGPDTDGQVGSVVAKDGRPKDWTMITRAVSSRKVADSARALVSAVVRDGVEASEAVPGPSAPLRAVPVLGPENRVHAVLLYEGDDPEAPPPTTTAWNWRSADHQFVYTPDMFDIVAPIHHPRLTATAFEFFDNTLDPDSAMYMMVALLDANPDTRWDGSIVLTASPGGVPLRTAFRTVQDPNSDLDQVSHGLSTTLRDGPVRHGPSVEALALRSLTRHSPTAIALMDLERVRLVRWLTDPVPDVLWKGQTDQRDTPHPDDIARIVTIYRGMRRWPDRPIEIPSVRLRRTDGAWTVVDIRASRVPGQRFLMVEFQPVGLSNEPDPVPATDTGYPGRGPRLRD